MNYKQKYQYIFTINRFSYPTRLFTNPFIYSIENLWKKFVTTVSKTDITVLVVQQLK